MSVAWHAQLSDGVSGVVFGRRVNGLGKWILVVRTGINVNWLGSRIRDAEIIRADRECKQGDTLTDATGARANDAFGVMTLSGVNQVLFRVG